MKNIAAALLALLLLAGACAFAFTGANYPAWDGVSPPQNSLCGSFGGEKISLDFDPAGEFSKIANGTLQACFFAFDASEENYLEMYLQMRDDIAAGDVLSSGIIDALSSVTLYEISETAEDIYYAGQIVGYAYPEGSNHEVHIEEANRSADAFTVSGSLSALLCKFDENDRPTGETLQLSDVRFHFSMPVNGASLPAAPKETQAPKNSAAPDATELPLPTIPQLPVATPKPKYTMDPHPAFTLPPDYAAV